MVKKSQKYVMYYVSLSFKALKQSKTRVLCTESKKKEMSFSGLRMSYEAVEISDLF